MSTEKDLLQSAAPALADLGVVLEKHSAGESSGLALALALHLESLCRVCDVYSEDLMGAAKALIDGGHVHVPTPNIKQLGSGR